MIGVLIPLIFLIVPLALLIYARWNYGTLEKLGIPVIPPSFILGSTPDLHQKVAHFEDISRYQKYGSVYGLYEGRKPVICICDPDLIRLILVRDIEHFKDRRVVDLGDDTVNEMMDFSPYEKWKELRPPTTAFFTMGRLKLVSHSMKEAINDMITSIRADCNFEKGSPVKLIINRKYEAFYLDLNFRAAFGIKIDDHLNPHNEILKTFRNISGQDADFDFMYNLTMTFPFLTRLAPTLASDAINKVATTFRSALGARIASGQKFNDFADILNEMITKTNSPTFKALGITERSIIAQGFNFILAGYDAMETTSTMLTYFLAQHPHIQEKLHEEIDNFLEENGGNIPFEKLADLHYLNACIYEAMRLVPPFIRPERICTKDWQHNSLKIPKGTLVMIPAWAVHRNPKEFPEPEQFRPERFMPENKSKIHPYAFMTFGQGPRNCIGMRFAIEGMKYTFAHLLKEFRFEMRADTTIKWKTGVLFFVQYDDVPINICKR